MNPDGFLDIAASIGRRLARQALWEGTGCHWRVTVPDTSTGQRRSRVVRTDGTLYQGSAGIAWFLGEMYRATGDAEMGRAARGGLAHAVAEGEKLPSRSFGFYGGRVGIAWVAARLAEILGTPDDTDAARRLLEPLSGQESLDAELDVIGGGGGAIPVLLEQAARWRRDDLTAMARRLGDQLLRRAHSEPAGWSWDIMRDSVARYLTGLAHGASGMALALLELAHATGEGRFRFGAEMAFLYERQFFSPRHDNWPDLRHRDFLQFHPEEERRRMVREQGWPPYEPRYIHAWCYGAPGIGLARLRAFELTGHELYRLEAEAALRSTLMVIGEERFEYHSFSLCHGVGGNCELPLLAAEILEDPSSRQAVERVALRGAETYEAAGRPWPCGTLGGVSDPSLMLGEAGIGAFYLRLADPDTPSVLLRRPRIRGQKTDMAGFEALAREAVEESFGLTRRVFARLGVGSEPSASPPLPLERSPVETAYSALLAVLGEEDEGRRRLLEDAFLPERLRYELTLGITDFTEENLRLLRRLEWDEVDPREARFVRASGARLVATSHDWQAWLETGDEEAVPPEREVYFLLHPEDHGFRCQRVGPLPALVLEAAEETATLEEIADHLARALDRALDARELIGKILPQLEEIYRAGFIDAFPGVAPPAGEPG